MKKSKKLGIILCMGLVTIMAGCSCSKKDDTKKKAPEEELHLNTSENVIKEQTIDDIKFSGVTLLIDEGISKFSVKVSNPTNQARVLGVIVFTFKDKDGTVLLEQKFPVDVLTAGETTDIAFTSDMNLNDADVLEYTIKSE